ncbi:hypothetical protein XBJ1_1931 [Xenorhabdus bovienii SS-2004]|uniref:Uncharacterized protein n=1 Tax=Xenorhabdus bovienii (strain SS-2004) TaxID=406818 RepID=D3V2U2_XENBS|nr:hypothetical protein XBJ1_1931 [Xenorhabdus bovienii SS-2004]
MLLFLKSVLKIIEMYSIKLYIIYLINNYFVRFLRIIIHGGVFRRLI